MIVFSLQTDASSEFVDAGNISRSFISSIFEFFCRSSRGRRRSIFVRLPQQRRLRAFHSIAVDGWIRPEPSSRFTGFSGHWHRRHAELHEWRWWWRRNRWWRRQQRSDTRREETESSTVTHGSTFSISHRISHLSLENRTQSCISSTSFHGSLHTTHTVWPPSIASNTTYVFCVKDMSTGVWYIYRETNWFSRMSCSLHWMPHLDSPLA